MDTQNTGNEIYLGKFVSDLKKKASGQVHPQQLNIHCQLYSL